MTHKTTIIATISAILALTMTMSFVGTNTVSAAHSGFITSTDPYLQVADPIKSSVTAIITDGDTVDSYTFNKLPDGIGFVKGKGDQASVFMNHELSNADGNSKVSRLEIDRKSLNVDDAKYVIDGILDGTSYSRFCSSNMASEGSFKKNPVYLTGEEDDSVGHGVAIAIDAKTNAVTELPWLGYFAHENVIDVPYFANGDGRNNGHDKDHGHKDSNTVILSFEDGPAGDSEVYMYVADSADGALSGKGQLYVFSAVNYAAYQNWGDIYYGGSIQGKFVPVSWDYATQTGADLDAAAKAAHAFEFIRAEDGTMDVRKGYENVLYMADTGNNSVTHGPLTGDNGQTFENGRIYKFTFTNPSDPTEVTLEVILDGNDVNAPGYGMKNPDNLGTSDNSLMVQEDRNGYNRPAVVGSFDITQSGKIWQYDLGTGAFAPVAYVDQSYDTTNPPYGTWESSGIVDASSVFGKGTWLVDVQAHSLSEGGQLLLLKVKNS